jgi:hypothetical protein
MTPLRSVIGALRLDGGLGGEVAPGAAVGKPDVILDAQAGSGLSARSDGVEGNSVEALRRSVYRGGQAGRASSDHHQVGDRSGDTPIG